MRIHTRFAALAATCAVGLCAAPSPAKAPQVEEMQRVVLRHMAQDVVAHDAASVRKLRFRFVLRLRPGQKPLRLVERVHPVEDGREQHQERYPVGKPPTREVELPAELNERLSRMARAFGQGQRRNQGSIEFECGQVRWDGRRHAIVEASWYNTGIHGGCSLQGYSYQLEKVRGHWRVLGRCATAAAG